MSNTRVNDLNELKELDDAELKEVVGGNALLRWKGSRHAPRTISPPSIFETNNAVDPRAVPTFALTAAKFKNAGGNYNKGQLRLPSGERFKSSKRSLPSSRLGPRERAGRTLRMLP